MEQISTKSFKVRRAEANDMKEVHQMIQELADFEKMSSGPELSVQDLIRDAGLDGGREIFHCYIAEIAQMDGSTLKVEPIGYAICYFSFSTWQGKSYDLQSFYIKEQYRNKSFGKKLFTEVEKNAKVFGCKRINFHVLDWNPARKFYQNMGAKNLTELEGWQLYRLNLKTIGYSICFFSYSMWQIKSYFMEDLYVKPEFRNKGIGLMLLKEVISNAKTFGCKSVDFHVLDWNPARKFYEKIGAKNLTTEGWHFYRLEDDVLNKLVDF